jgi:hypothetical protein
VPKPKDRRTRAAEMWAAGKTLREIAAALDVSHPTVLEWVKGLPPRGCRTCGSPRPNPKSLYCKPECRPSHRPPSPPGPGVRRPVTDLTGTPLAAGGLVLGPADPPRSSGNAPRWAVRCGCGRGYVARGFTAADLAARCRACSYWATNPGAAKPEINTEYGFWTVLGPAPRRGPLSRWRCRCRCGAEGVRTTTELLRDYSTRCRACNVGPTWAKTCAACGAAFTGTKRQRWCEPDCRPSRRPGHVSTPRVRKPAHPPSAATPTT